MRPAIVGEAPSMQTSRPFAGRSGERLAELAGVTLEELGSSHRLVNLLRYWPGPDGSKGSAFPLAEARERAARIRLADGSLLCGRRVAAAFGLRGVPFFEWTTATRCRSRVAVVPHPSGISHWWNDPENVERARAFLREAVR